MGAKELCRRDGYLALCQWQDVDTGRQTGCTQHHLLLLVIDQHIVDDHPVEETQVHPSDGNLGAKFLSDGLSRLLAKEGLTGWNMCEEHQQNVQGQETPYNDVDDIFQQLHSIKRLYFSAKLR